MSNDQFTVEEPKKSGGGCTTAIIGCLVVCLVLAGIACGLGIYGWMNRVVIGASIAESVANGMIDGSDLPEDQKTRMKEQTSRLAKGVRDGDITIEQVGQVGEKIAESPAITAIPVEVARSKYIEPSGLSDDEKAEAKKQLQRVAHGAFEEKVSEEELKALLDGRIADEGSDGNLQFRENVPDENLRDMTSAAKKLADEKGVPDQNFDIDLAAELKKAVDAVLLGTPEEEELQIEIPETPVEVPMESQLQDVGN